MIEERIQTVLSEIEAARKRRTRVPQEAPVQLVAMTKNHGVDAMREAIDAGMTDIGENRVQEAMEKHRILDRSVKWHLVGHLQTNKAKQAVQMFDMIHSVDSVHLAQAVNRAAGAVSKVQEILVQVNLAKEESKFGVYRENLDELIREVRGMPHLKLRGLMCIAPEYEDPEMCRPLFREMYDIFRAMQGGPLGAEIEYLSIGMTCDYPIAVEEGANIVRIGTAIFGKRIYKKQGE